MVTPASVQLNRTQFGYARHIVQAVHDRHLPKRVAVIALEVALTESNLTMYANAYNPDSLDHPHEAVGSDHGSVGLFQQQVGGAPHSTADWGTTKELMDPEISCDKFLRALGSDWKHNENWVAAQNTQNSAYDGSPRPANHFTSEYGGNYRTHDDKAARIVNAIWAGVGDLATELVDHVTPPDPGKFWVDTFERAPVFAEPNGPTRTGWLYAGHNYVFGKRWGADVHTAQGFNHWWLRTDPDEGTGQWVSAYYLTHWGDDEAKDNAGTVIPNC